MRPIKGPLDEQRARAVQPDICPRHNDAREYEFRCALIAALVYIGDCLRAKEE